MARPLKLSTFAPAPRVHKFKDKMTLQVLLGFLGGMGGGEIFLVLVVILLFFGAKRLPDLARGLGKGIKEFKDAKNGVETKEEEKK